MIVDSFARGELGEEELRRLLVMHATNESLRENFEYYLGGRRVEKGVTAKGRPDCRANTNLAKYITDVATGYFVGQPPVYNCSDEQFEKILHNVFDYNNETSINYEIAENMSITGVGYDLVYLGEGGKIRIAPIDPRECFVVRAQTLEAPIVAGVRTWRDDKGGYFGEMYLPWRTVSFKWEGNVRFLDEYPTPFSQPNLTQYRNNRFMMGDFETVKSNIDLYNLTVSNVTDDLQSIANAYLVLSGFEQPDESVLELLRNERVLGMPVDGSASYITKNLNDAAIENHKRTLRRDILQVAGVPDLSDEHFASAQSGVAMRYKLWATEQLFSKKRAGMEEGLFRRLALIADAARLIYNVDIGEVSEMVSIKFKENMPKNTSLDVENTLKMQGVISKKTLLENLESATGVVASDELSRIVSEEG